MKQFNLEEYLKNPKKKVVTKDGRSVRIICTDFDNPKFPVIGEIEGGNWPISFTTMGLFNSYGESNHDLFFAPEKHEKWVNVYLRSNGDLDFGNTCSSKEEAKDGISSYATYITTVKIEWGE